MRLEWYEDPATGDLRFEGSVTRLDLLDLDLDPIDRAVINTRVETAADMLQTLEIMFRRGHEAAQRKKAQHLAPS